jgi:hypothetical protein
MITLNFIGNVYIQGTHVTSFNRAGCENQIQESICISRLSDEYTAVLKSVIIRD